jgi:hypothetical protein
VSWTRRLFGRHDNEPCHRVADPHRDLDRQVEEARAERHEAAQIRADAEKQGSRLRQHLEANNFGRRFAAAFGADDRRQERHA